MKSWVTQKLRQASLGDIIIIIIIISYFFSPGAEQFRRLQKRRSGEARREPSPPGPGPGPRPQPPQPATAAPNFILYLSARSFATLTGSLPRYLPNCAWSSSRPARGAGGREGGEGSPSGPAARTCLRALPRPPPPPQAAPPAPPLYLPRGPRAGPPRRPWRLIGRRPTNPPSPRAGGTAYVKPYFIFMSSERGFKSLIRRAGELLVPTGRACRRRLARRARLPSARRSATETLIYRGGARRMVAGRTWIR